MKQRDDELKKQNMLLTNKKPKEAPKIKVASPTAVQGILKESARSPTKKKIMIGGQEFTDYDEDSSEKYQSSPEESVGGSPLTQSPLSNKKKQLSLKKGLSTNS